MQLFCVGQAWTTGEFTAKGLARATGMGALGGLIGAPMSAVGAYFYPRVSFLEGLMFGASGWGTRVNLEQLWIKALENQFSG